MIYGIGTDLCEVSRIAAAWERFGEAFPRRILMPQELADYQRLRARGRDPVRFLAMRFAAKEALVKALGTGFRQGVWVRDVGHTQLPSGKPVPLFSAAVRQRLDAAGAGEGHISLTDEAGLVAAFAVILMRSA
jgi:holo-[acyl-carrier protein] synthase